MYQNEMREAIAEKKYILSYMPSMLSAKQLIEFTNSTNREIQELEKELESNRYMAMMQEHWGIDEIKCK